MSRVVYSARTRIRVTFPEFAQAPAEAALRNAFDRVIPTKVANRFYAAQYQIVRIDVFDDGTVRMSTALEVGK